MKERIRSGFPSHTGMVLTRAMCLSHLSVSWWLGKFTVSQKWHIFITVGIKYLTMGEILSACSLSLYILMQWMCHLRIWFSGEHGDAGLMFEHPLPSEPENWYHGNCSVDIHDLRKNLSVCVHCLLVWESRAQQGSQKVILVKALTGNNSLLKLPQQ